MTDVQFEKDVQQFKATLKKTGKKILARTRRIVFSPFTRRFMPTWCRVWGCVCMSNAVLLAWIHTHNWSILSVAVDVASGCWMFWLASKFTKEVHFVIPMPETLGGVDIEVTSQDFADKVSQRMPRPDSKKVN